MFSKLSKSLIILLISVSAFAAEISACFTPGEDCTSQIVRVIDSAKSTVLVQAYGFTSDPIILAIISAKNRGVFVKVLLDKSQLRSRRSGLNRLLKNNIDTYIDNTVAIAHNKIIIVDRATLITGSFNFTSSAQKRNAENVIRINDIAVIDKYIKNFEKREKKSIFLNKK